MKRFLLSIINDPVIAVLSAFAFWVIVIVSIQYGCNPSPPPTPTPSPSPSLSPSPSPTITPNPLCNFGTNKDTWTELASLTPSYITDVKLAEDSIGDVCGLEPESSLDKLSAELNSRSLCAGRIDDAVFVKRLGDESLFDEYRAVDYSNGCWVSDSYKGTWKYASQ